MIDMPNLNKRRKKENREKRKDSNREIKEKIKRMLEIYDESL